MSNWIDGTLYPDTGVPEELETPEDRVDFLARLCSAWDFGLLPDRETIDEIRQLSAGVRDCQITIRLQVGLNPTRALP